MTTPKVSIVVSVYNGQNYIAECLDTVINQTFKDFECVVVNDGSTDKTSSIIKKYSLKDKRVRIINKENGGVSTARNAGLDAAVGEFIIFLDGDDFYEKKFIECMYKEITKANADIAVCNFKNYFQQMNKYSEPRVDFGLLSGKVISVDTDPENIFNVLTLMFWNKLFRTDFLRKHKIRNDESLHRAQDIDAVAKAIIEADHIVAVDQVLVYYRTEAGGSNVGRLYEHPYDVLRALTNVKDYLHKKSTYKKTYKSYVKFAVDHVLAALYVTELYPVHKSIFLKSKDFFEEIKVKNIKEEWFNDSKTFAEANALIAKTYEEWLQFRIVDLRDDHESKYISYLLGEFQRKFEEEKQARLEEARLREDMESSLSWRITRPLRKVRSILR